MYVGISIDTPPAIKTWVGLGLFTEYVGTAQNYVQRICIIINLDRALTLRYPLNGPVSSEETLKKLD
jgi:hypothetical protein